MASKALSGAAFYVPMNAPPELFGVLARALLKAPEPSLRAAARGRGEPRDGRGRSRLAGGGPG